MATTIITKNGSGAPAAGDLVQGELAVDLTNQTLYSKDSSGNVFKVGDTGGGSPGTFTDLVATDSFTSPGIDDNATSTAITIDSGQDVGIGTDDPRQKLVVSSSDNGFEFDPNASTGNRLLSYSRASGQYSDMNIKASTFQIDTGATGTTSAMTIDASGNVGIGVTPESWTTYTPVQVQQASLASYNNGDARLTNNGYYNGGWKYIDSRPATQYLMDAGNGIHTWSTAASGTADGAITWSERMRIDAAGTTTVTGGFEAAQPGSGTGAFAAGDRSGATSQGIYTVAIGYAAGETSQGDYSVASGFAAGQATQGSFAVALGNSAGKTTQGLNCVAIGSSAGGVTQSESAVAVGASAGYQRQGTHATAFGDEAGYTDQGSYAVAMGPAAGKTDQGDSAVAVGWEAGLTTQGSDGVAIGRNAGQTTQGDYSISIGRDSGYTGQEANAVAIGVNAGKGYQGNSGVAIGNGSGFSYQSDYGTAVGVLAGETDQGESAVAIGDQAGRTTQGLSAVAIGRLAGQTSQGTRAIAIGNGAGISGQLVEAIAIGRDAGTLNQQANSIAIGTKAGEVNQGANGIIINSSGVAKDVTASDHIYLTSGTGKYLYYDGSTSWEFRGGDLVVPNDNLLVNTTSGITNVGAKVQVESNANGEAGIGMRHSGSTAGKFMRMWTSSVNALYVQNNGNTGVVLTDGATTWTSTSDENLKENISDIGPVLDTIKDFQCVNYSLKATESEAADKVGFIAQDWEHTFPSVVGKDEEGTLSMKYTETIPVLLKAIQEQQAMIETLQAEVAALKGA